MENRRVKAPPKPAPADADRANLVNAQHSLLEFLSAGQLRPADLPYAGSSSRKPDQEEMDMRNKAVYLFAAAILVLALAFSAAAPAAPSGKASPAPSPQPAASQPAAPEEHPQIHDALAALRQAKAHLEHAKHDFGGHRADALHATEEAIHQLEICQKYDK
jgi:hypothetical protein